VNLVDAQTLRQLGARAVDVRREDLSKMEDGLLDLVVELLDLNLQPQARSALNSGGTSVAEAYDAYLQGRGYLRRYDKPGNLEQAVAEFKQALQRDSRYALAYAGLGEAYLREFGRTKSPEWLELAQDANARAIELNERLAPAHVNLGMTYAASGNYAASIKEFNRALELDSLNADAYRELAGTYEAQNRMEDAEATYRRAIQLRPSDWLGNGRLGTFYYRRGQYAKAEPLFKKVIELTPDNYNGYSNLGGLYIALDRYAEAESLLKKSVTVKPNFLAYSNLGTLYFEQGRYKEAVGMFEQALNLSADSNYVVVGNLADSYRWTPGLQQKAPAAYQRAIELAEQQLAVNPKNAAVLSSMAVFHAKLGETANALNESRRAREFAPEDTTVAFKAVVVLELNGRRPEAVAALEGLLKGGYPRTQVEREPELARLRRDPLYIAAGSQDAASKDPPTKPK
jgi:serine/threonine-protein kinase